ncbi:MAG: S8 family serine peptidase [Chlorobi bacterium]|nr:S8 family serine peptidase [Chlorobiota bacterium]
MESSDGRIVEMMYLDVFGLPQYYTTNNSNAAISIGSLHVFQGGSLGADLDGEGMTLYQWDGGKIYFKHPELLGRAFPSDQNSPDSRHATHVAGTMVGSGVNPLARGMAPRAILSSYNWNNDIAEMALGASREALLSNHSYGYIRGWYFVSGMWNWAGNLDISVTEDYQFGFYDENTRLFDEVAYYAPNYLIVKSAGNDRGNGSAIENPPYPVDGPYDCLPQVATAKNILSVGAVFDLPGGYKGPSSVNIAPFSSWGPTDDGRIKPDIVANGIGLLSCTELTSLYTQEVLYGKYSGTSMAAPSVTGSLGLIQEHYQSINGTGNFMFSATLKALVIQTADEAGTEPGPDYSYGWGLMNTTKALLKISEDQMIDVISEHVLDENQVYSREVYVSGNKPLKVTVVWTDFPGTPTSPQLDPLDPMLVNDLDLKITKDGNTWFPWKLDRDNPANPASSTTKNDVDNVEVVLIENPIPGNYAITVDHDGSLTNGSQAFSMVVDGISENNPPIADFYYTVGIEGNPKDVQFMDASFGEPGTWSWTVSPNYISFIGGTNASSWNPLIRFDEPNCYDVTMTVSNSFGTHQVNKQVCHEPLPCNYCSSSYANVPDTFIAIEHVSFNTISNSSGNFNGLVGYEDYTDIPTDVFRFSTVKLEVKVSLSFPGIFSGYCFAWIDWNQDCDFDDPGEEYNLGSFIDSDVNDVKDPLSMDIIVPGNALKGKTRMRVAIREGLEPTPCNVGTEKGEVEDYTIVVHYSDYPGFWTGLSSSEWAVPQTGRAVFSPMRIQM